MPLSEANGICENGHTESTDFDCRFVAYVPILTNSNGDVVAPQCIPYSDGNCVFYRVGNTPPTTSYQGPIHEYIAWNNEDCVPLSTYQANNPRLFDDPDDPPYIVNHQFVFDITDTYQPTGAYVGVDAGLGGRTCTSMISPWRTPVSALHTPSPGHRLSVRRNQRISKPVTPISPGSN